MNFDHTYITLFGAIIFEPVTILTNTFIMIFCLYAFIKLFKNKFPLSFHWSLFFLLIGISSQIGSIAHGIQFQLGDTFLKIIIFSMNAVSLIAIFYCFKAANTYFNQNKESSGKVATLIAAIWVFILLVITFVQNNFVLIKINAGIVLTYSLVIHIITYYKAQKGSGYIAIGIIISFFSIVVHSLRFSLSPWFNYKDISHVIMLLSLFLIYQRVTIKVKEYTLQVPDNSSAIG